MSVRDRVTNAVYREGLIEDPLDVAVGAVILLAAAVAVVVTLTPAIALYTIARHAGMGALGALAVGVGGYGVFLAYLRFGGVTVNVNH